MKTKNTQQQIIDNFIQTKHNNIKNKIKTSKQNNSKNNYLKALPRFLLSFKILYLYFIDAFVTFNESQLSKVSPSYFNLKFYFDVYIPLGLLLIAFPSFFFKQYDFKHDSNTQYNHIFIINIQYFQLFFNSFQIPLIFLSPTNFFNKQTKNIGNPIYNKTNIDNQDYLENKRNINYLATNKTLLKLFQKKTFCSRFSRKFSWPYNFYKKK